MHIDVHSGILADRPAQFIRDALVGLLTMDSRLYRVMNPSPDQAPNRNADMDEEG